MGRLHPTAGFRATPDSLAADVPGSHGLTVSPLDSRISRTNARHRTTERESGCGHLGNCRPDPKLARHRKDTKPQEPRGSSLRVLWSDPAFQWRTGFEIAVNRPIAHILPIR